MASNNDGWEELVQQETGDTWKYADEGEGAELVGTYTGMTANVGQNNSNMYNFTTKSGVVSVWGTSLLDNRLKNIELGEEVKLVYKGKAKSEKTGRQYHDFAIYHRPAQKKS